MDSSEPARLDRVERVEAARALMLAFAEDTGLGSARPRRRYLWTDAFAVCTFLGLARATGERLFRQLALELIDQVHHTLGRHRADDVRSGWLSGLGEREGEEHPTRGGLRIGKALPERRAGERPDEPLEWDRDGQYFHYSTRWMHALDVTARATGAVRFHRWARELAQVASRAFTVADPDGGRPRMVWKMSIDLSRPLVPTMGQHDPLDGLITCAQIEDTGRALNPGASGPVLADEMRGFASMFHGQSLVTSDALGLGGLLADAGRVAQLSRRGSIVDGALLQSLLTAVLAGLPQLLLGGALHLPAQARLPFRELGLAIGLAAVDTLSVNPESGVRARIQELARYEPLRRAIQSFWLEPAHRRVASFTGHLDINNVMLATSLVPEGYLLLPSPP